MRILAISNLFPPYYLGGYELLCAQVAERAIRAGHQVAVLTSTWSSGATDEERDGVRVLRRLELCPDFPAAPQVGRRHALAAGRRNAAATAQTIAAWRPDVVALWSQLRLTAGPSRATLTSGQPCAWIVNDLNILSLAPRAFAWRPRTIARWALDRTLGRAATLSGLPISPATTISRMLRDEVTAGGLDIADAALIHQGIAIADFPLRQDAGRLANPVRVLYAGQVLHQKGVHVAAEAIRDLQRGGRDVAFTIAGDGDAHYMEELRRQLADVPRVVWLGRVSRDRMPGVYRDHDLLLFPSIHREGFGLTFLEAMASGLPVIATTGGGHSECLVDRDNALVVPPRDASAIARAIALLIDDEPLRHHLITRGRAMVEQRFTIDRYADDLIAFLDRARTR